MLTNRANEGKPTKLVDDEPELLADAAPYWEAFQALRGQRDVGFGAGEIRREAVTDYLSDHGITDPEEREAYRDYVTVLDREYLAAVAERTTKPDTAKGGNRQTLQGRGR